MTAKFKRFGVDMDLCVTAVRMAWAATYREVGPPTHLFVPPELKPIDPTLLYYIEKEFELEIEIQPDLDKNEWCVGYYNQDTGDKVYTWGSSGY